LFKSEPPSGRNPKWPLPQKRICTQPNPPSWSALRPPHIGPGSTQHPGRPRGRHRGQAPSHIWTGIDSTAWSAPRPPSGASPLPQLDRREPGRYPSAKTTTPRRNGALSLFAAPITSWRQVQQVRQPLQPWLGP
ncbi:hypothetical protein EUX57_24250, partial [Pseudomonas orientalis]